MGPAVERQAGMGLRDRQARVQSPWGHKQEELVTNKI
jgi:hypothetical protein